MHGWRTCAPRCEGQLRSCENNLSHDWAEKGLSAQRDILTLALVSAGLAKTSLPGESLGETVTRPGVMRVEAQSLTKLSGCLF